MAKFPEYRFEKTIGEMKVGESGYTVPWAMDVREDGEAVLNPNFTIHESPGGTVSMYVYRSKDCGFIVDIRRVFNSYRWSKSTYLEPEYIQVADILS